jgi:hypothetical protein
MIRLQQQSITEALTATAPAAALHAPLQHVLKGPLLGSLELCQPLLHILHPCPITPYARTHTHSWHPPRPMVLRAVMLQQALCCVFDPKLHDSHVVPQPPDTRVHLDACPGAYKEECRPHMSLLWASLLSLLPLLVILLLLLQHLPLLVISLLLLLLLLLFPQLLLLLLLQELISRV